MSNRRMFAWETLGENGERISHFKTVNEDGVTIGEHTETQIGYARAMQVISGNPSTHERNDDPLCLWFGVPCLTDACQEGVERKKITYER